MKFIYILFAVLAIIFATSLANPIPDEGDVEEKEEKTSSTTQAAVSLT
jgi:hypothetical protein